MQLEAMGCLQENENSKRLVSVVNLIQLGFAVNKSFSQVPTPINDRRGF